MENLPSSYLSAQLGQGLVVMVLGMLVVFLFLTLLIGAVKLMSLILKRFAKEEEIKPQKAAAGVANKVVDDSDKIAVAIIAALEKERE